MVLRSIWHIPSDLQKSLARQALIPLKISNTLINYLTDEIAMIGKNHQPKMIL
jgi:hypothetical protein